MNRSEIMAAIRSKDTEPELIVRRIVHAMGYRYRLHRSDLPGKPDLVFAGRRKIIFVHGCFWHQHGCAYSHIPKSNVAYWAPKLKRNHARDLEHLRKLRAHRWKCLVLWECELAKPERLRHRLLKFLATH
jgi:DNA mismatch endonuclease, patch repair protein